MERTLLWASLVIGIVVYLCRFLPPRGDAADGAPAPEPIQPALRLVALLAPVVGFLVTLPAHVAFFGTGQRLGWGFLIGGAAMLLAHLDLLVPRRVSETSASGRIASVYGAAIVAVTLALLLLRQSLHDGLMGVAIGGFCVAFALLLALPRSERGGAAGQRLASGAGMLAALATAASLGVFRDPLSPALAKETWSAILVAFAAVGTLAVTGADLLPASRIGAGRLLPLLALLGVGSLSVYYMTTKIADKPVLALVAGGGILVWAVALAVLRENAAGGSNGNGDSSDTGTARANPLLAVPLLSVLVVASAFLAALQTLQGVGAAMLVVALYLAFPATMTFLAPPKRGASGSLAPPTGGLLLFATVLLLWRLFETRWHSDLRGVTLSDQYALWGLLVGAALPGLLASVSVSPRFKGGAGIMRLSTTVLLAVATPTIVLILFGTKSAAALLIGLALGAVPGAATPTPGLIAVAVALVLAQWTGAILPAHTSTRKEKIRYLLLLGAGLVVAPVAGNRFAGTHDTAKDEE